MQVEPDDIKNLTGEEAKKYSHAMALKGKIESVSEKLMDVESDGILNFAHNEPGMVRAEISEQKASATVTIKGELKYDTATKIPMKMEVQEHLFASGIGSSVRDSAIDFIYKETEEEKIYGMRRFGVQQELKINKISGIIDYNESKIHILNENFTFNYDY